MECVCFDCAVYDEVEVDFDIDACMIHDHFSDALA